VSLHGDSGETELQEDEMDAGEPVVTRDEHNLARVFQSALREADACADYALDTETAGNERFANFFRDVQRTYAEVAERAEEILGDGGEGRPQASVRPGSVPAEGDPGDVSPGRNVVHDR
jgi:hypothetical protein